MEVLDHEPWSWFLLASGRELLLDVHVSHGPVSWSLLLVLDEPERDALAREGRAFLSRLAAQVQGSAPISAGARSPYRERDVQGSLGGAVTDAVRAWRQSNGSDPGGDGEPSGLTG